MTWTLDVGKYGVYDVEDNVDVATAIKKVREVVEGGNTSSSPMQNEQPHQQQQPPVQNVSPNKFAQYLNDAANSPVTNFVLGAGDGFTNSQRNLANFLTPDSFPQLKSKLMKSGEGSAYDVGSVAGDIGSYALLGSSLGNALKAAESLPYLGRAASKLIDKAPGVAGEFLEYVPKDILSRALGGPAGVARRAAGAALYGASQNEDDRLAGAGEMGAASLGMDALLGVAARAAPGRMFAKSAFPTEQILENLRVSEGTPTGLGNVIGVPNLQRLKDNLLVRLPMSGAHDDISAVENLMKNKQQGYIDSLLGDTNREYVNEGINKNLNQLYKEQNSIKNKLYEEPQKMSDSLGFKVKATNLASNLDDFDDIRRSQSLIGDSNTQRLLSKATKLDNNLNFHKVDGVRKRIDEGGELSLKEAGILKGKLNDFSSVYKKSPSPTDRNLSGAYSRLAKSLNSDIDHSLDEWSAKGYPIIKESYDKANKNYATKFSKLLDKEIYAHIGGDKTPASIVNSFIKTGQSDDSAKIKKLMNVLPPEGQDLLKYSYLTRALEDQGKVNLGKLKTALGDSKIGEFQKKALFNKPGEEKQLTDFIKLSNMNSDAGKKMLNPHTGQKYMDVLPFLGASLAGIFGGGLPGALVGYGGTLASGNFANKLLRNEKVRNAVAKAIIKERENPGRVGNVRSGIYNVSVPAFGNYMRDYTNPIE